MIAQCPFDCVIGNGYAPVLPFFAEFGQTRTLVQVRRGDRDACIRSLMRNCELFPTTFGYYSDSDQATIKRMAAFHFGEMTRACWDRLPLVEKLAWYYDKTHALIDAASGYFPEYLEVVTEHINDEQTATS